MLNKVVISVKTSDGIKEASVYLSDSRGYVLVFDEHIHFCNSRSELFMELSFFIVELEKLPYYENEK